MAVVSGLPAYVLFVPFVVVLVPLTALLEIVCALWRALHAPQRQLRGFVCTRPVPRLCCGATPESA